MLGHARTHVLPAALSLLPPEMDSPAARAMLLAIGLQETRFRNRTQVRGPARGFWQFELGGAVADVLTRRSTRQHAEAALTALRYPTFAAHACFVAIEHNDVLAAVFARLNLWTLPDALPQRAEAERGWEQYVAAWHPGKPHRETWDANFARAWGEA